MSLFDDLRKSIDYIEENIKEKITLDDIAKHLYVSKYHFHRIFKVITSQKLMEYVRMRKLSLSLNDLMYTDLKIEDIALDFGFEHVQSYNRSFKKAFGLTPSQFRLEKRSVPIVDKLDLKSIMPLESGIMISPYFVVKPEFYIIGIKHHLLVNENFQKNLANELAKDFFYNHRKKINSAVNSDLLISYSTYEDITSNESLYLPALEVFHLNDIPEGMCTEKIKAHKYGVFKYIGSHSADTITLKILDNIYKHTLAWLLKSQYVQDGSFHFEVIDSSLSRADYCEVDIYIPIKAKA
jgi:AraC family transcriptional regulator